jgi:hypothetical protein
MTDYNVLQYKDFYDSVEFSAPDECLFIRIAFKFYFGVCYRGVSQVKNAMSNII